MLLWALAGCGEQNLTLETVVKLSEKGEALSWEDFDHYPYQEVGSGLYIRRYHIDETFDLLIGGPGGSGPQEEPWYIYLRCAERDSFIDIRTEDAAAFIQEIRGA